MRSFEAERDEFERRGLRIAAISVDPPDVNRAHRRAVGVGFPLLSDTGAEVTRRYDLVHTGAGPGGADIPRPAEFLVDAQGIVRWAHLTPSYTARARPDQLLAAADEHGLR